MIYEVFSVYDSKAKFYSRPVYMRNKDEAIRSFGMLANDKNTEIGLHPEDFALFLIGKWDEDKGMFSQPIPKESLAVAIELVRNEKNIIPGKMPGQMNLTEKQEG